MFVSNLGLTSLYFSTSNKFAEEYKFFFDVLVTKIFFTICWSTANYFCPVYVLQKILSSHIFVQVWKLSTFKTTPFLFSNKIKAAWDQCPRKPDFQLSVHFYLLLSGAIVSFITLTHSKSFHVTLSITSFVPFWQKIKDMIQIYGVLIFI